jgi:transposase
MGLSRRRFTKESKLAAVRRLEQVASIAEVARALEVNPNVLHRWRREVRQGPGNAFPGNGKQRWSEGRIAELERKVGQQTLEIDFLKGCLQRIAEQRMLQALNGNPVSATSTTCPMKPCRRRPVGWRALPSDPASSGLAARRPDRVRQRGAGW